MSGTAAKSGNFGLKECFFPKDFPPLLSISFLKAKLLYEPACVALSPSLTHSLTHSGITFCASLKTIQLCNEKSVIASGPLSFNVFSLNVVF